MPQRLVYTPAEAAEMLGLSRAKLYLLIGDGSIASLKLGRSRRIRGEALAAYLDGIEHRADSPGAA